MAFERAQEYLNSNLSKVKDDIYGSMNNHINFINFNSYLNKLSISETEIGKLKLSYLDEIYGDSNNYQNYSVNTAKSNKYSDVLSNYNCKKTFLTDFFKVKLTQNLDFLIKKQKWKEIFLIFINNKIWETINSNDFFQYKINEIVKKDYFRDKYFELNRILDHLNQLLNLTNSVESILNELAIMNDRLFRLYDKTILVTKFFVFFERFHISSIKKIDKGFNNSNNAIEELRLWNQQTQIYLRYQRSIFKYVKSSYEMHNFKSGDNVLMPNSV